MLVPLSVTLLLLSGCGEDKKSDPNDAAADDNGGGSGDAEVQAQDGPADSLADTGPFPLPSLDSPVPLSVGAAGGPLPVPLGVPICGFMPEGGKQSAYSYNFPGTLKSWLRPTARVIAVEGGTSRLLLVRMDLIGITPQFVERVAHDVSEITGYDWTGKVIMGATHSHSSSGRLAQGAIWSMLADAFFPELFEKVVSGVVDLAVQAILDMEPGKLGHGFVETDKLHNDRRCENPELRDDRLHMLRFDRLDGSLKALMLVHSAHGTVLGAGELNLSRDIVGGIEEKVKESFDTPVEVLFFQAGAGDMSPGSPEVDNSGDLPVINSAYSRIEKVGELAAEAVQSSVWDIETAADARVESRWSYVPLGRGLMGYADGEFPYEGGGAYCGSTVDSECWSGEPTPIPDLDKKCGDISMLAEAAGFPGESAPDRTLLAAAWLGETLLATFPGEPVTQVLLNVEEKLKAKKDSLDVVVIGYAQDYVGYSTPEWDWYEGGYEASGAMWGPKQGDYLTDRAVEVAWKLVEPESQLSFVDSGSYPLLAPDVAPFKPGFSVTAPAITAQPAAVVAAGETVAVEFAGGDPWYLDPRVVLEKEGAGGFAEVLRPNGSAVDSRGYEFVLSVTYSPAYEEKKTAMERTFTWRAEMPSDRRVESAVFPLQGKYRFRITGGYRTVEAPDPAGMQYELFSEPFVVE
jgi:hypothetical protein